jgi:hypothetical protein
VDGPLAQLGIGETKISADGYRFLQRVRWPLMFCSCILFVMFNVLTFVSKNSMFSEKQKGEVHQSNYFNFGSPIMAPYNFIAGLTLFVGYIGAMLHGSTLARNAVKEVIKAVESTEPIDAEQWAQDVARPALNLDSTLRTLSEGWASGLFGMTLCCWSICMHCFCYAINISYNAEFERLNGLAPGTTVTKHFVMMSWLLLVPLVLAISIARTGSLCGDLMDSLNQVAIKYGEACHTRVDFLETRLKQLNRGQGLGFIFAGFILDIRALKTLALTLAGGLTTLITALFALTSPDEWSEIESGVCSLSDSQLMAIKGVVQSVVHNSTCTFNITLAEILAN